MSNIKIFNRSIPSIGYFARTTTKGEEFDMVNQYIKFIIKHYSKLKSKNAAIFIEPQIDTGYPDIVVVEYYKPNKSKQFKICEFRKQLVTTDLKILYNIQRSKHISIKELSEILGYSLSEVKKSTEHLERCGLIHLSKTRKHVRNVSLNKYCQIKKIISIEAKLDKWSEAIRQAEKNIWFATESYILMNKETCNNIIKNKCSDLGIGIILVNGKVEMPLKSSVRPFPVSYASLLFNEWLYREACSREETI